MDIGDARPLAPLILALDDTATTFPSCSNPLLCQGGSSHRDVGVLVEEHQRSCRRCRLPRPPPPPADGWLALAEWVKRTLATTFTKDQTPRRSRLDCASGAGPRRRAARIIFACVSHRVWCLQKDAASVGFTDSKSAPPTHQRRCFHSQGESRWGTWAAPSVSSGGWKYDYTGRRQ